MDYLFEKGDENAGDLWILLHGSGRDESDLIPFVRSVSPGVSVLSIRGAIRSADGFAYFRRNTDNTPDLVDLHHQAERLEAFVKSTACFADSRRRTFLCGFSNGAVMAASLLLRGNLSFSGALLFRPMLPFKPKSARTKLSLPVLLVDAKHDDRRVPQDALELAGELRQSGADICHRTASSGHAPTENDVKAGGRLAA